MVEIRDGKKVLITPVSAEDLEDINIGDIIYLDGDLMTCCDVAHRRAPLGRAGHARNPMVLQGEGVRSAHRLHRRKGPQHVRGEQGVLQRAQGRRRYRNLQARLLYQINLLLIEAGWAKCARPAFSVPLLSPGGKHGKSHRNAPPSLTGDRADCIMDLGSFFRRGRRAGKKYGGGG